MKHLKPLNEKAHLIDKASRQGRSDEVVAMQTVAAAPPPPIPGWEVDMFGESPGCASRWRLISMVVPTLLVAAQVPDVMVTYPDWAGRALGGQDWRKLDAVFPKTIPEAD